MDNCDRPYQNKTLTVINAPKNGGQSAMQKYNKITTLEYYRSSYFTKIIMIKVPWKIIG